MFNFCCLIIFYRILKETLSSVFIKQYSNENDTASCYAQCCIWRSKLEIALLISSRLHSNHRSHLYTKHLLHNLQFYNSLFKTIFSITTFSISVLLSQKKSQNREKFVRQLWNSSDNISHRNCHYFWLIIFIYLTGLL